MFRGRHVHSIDAKGRVSIPSVYRTALQEHDDRPPILTNLLDSLALYPHEDWLEYERKITRLSSNRPDIQAFQRFMVSGAVEAPIDGQGRILVPPHLRDHARLERGDITIAGVGNRIELWNKERFEQDMARTQARFHDIASLVDGQNA